MITRANVFILSILSALALIWMMFGSLTILDPSATAWMAEGDMASYHVCSIFFAQDEWRWPPGLNPNYGEGLAGSIAQCSPSFLFSLGDKLLTSAGILDPKQQHHGYIILTNLALQFFASYLIFRHLLGARYTTAALLIALLFTQLPQFLVRNTGHVDLGAHYYILFGVLAILAGRTHLHLWFATLMLLSIFTHTYLFAMVFGLYCLGVILELSRVHSLMGRQEWLRHLAASSAIIATSVAIIVLLFYGLTGISPETSIKDSGYGFYRADLLTLFDGNGSIFLGDLPSDPGEYEGSFYLGVGFIIFFTLFGFFRITRRDRISVWPDCTLNWKVVMAFCILTTLFAASNRISIGPTEFTVTSRAWEEVGALFRASGRFIWLPAYILCIVTVFAVAKLLRPKQLMTLLVLANGLQFFEGSVRHGVYPDRAWSERYMRPMEAMVEAGVTGIRTMQPGFVSGDALFWEIAHPAAAVGLSVDRYYLARSNQSRAAELGRERISALLQSDFEPSFVYLIHTTEQDLLQLLDVDVGLFAYLMGDYVVVSGTSIAGLSAYEPEASAARQPTVRLTGRLLNLVTNDGWGPVEGSWGVWSVQNPATITIPKGVAGSSDFTISVTPLPVMAGRASTLSVVCPDRTDARIGQDGRYTCTIDGMKTSEIELLLETLHTPQELGINDDARRLGVALHEVEFSRQ